MKIVVHTFEKAEKHE